MRVLEMIRSRLCSLSRFMDKVIRLANHSNSAGSSGSAFESSGYMTVGREALGQPRTPQLHGPP